MSLLSQAALAILVVILPIYLWSLSKLYTLILAEKPEWVQTKGSLSFFYIGMPRLADPNVGMDVLRVVFSQLRLELSPVALKYAQRIRVLLPLGTVLFAICLAESLVRQP
jgi:hypothetical protein